MTAPATAPPETPCELVMPEAGKTDAEELALAGAELIVDGELVGGGVEDAVIESLSGVELGVEGTDAESGKVLEGGTLGNGVEPGFVSVSGGGSWPTVLDGSGSGGVFVLKVGNGSVGIPGPKDVGVLVIEGE
jgi:hypothetical protein